MNAIFVKLNLTDAMDASVSRRVKAALHVYLAENGRRLNQPGRNAVTTGLVRGHQRGDAARARASAAFAARRRPP